jgi:hypothetical protein
MDRLKNKHTFNFNIKVGRECIFKLTIGNESLHEICGGIRVVIFTTSINLTVKSTMFPHHNIYKHMWRKKNIRDLNVEKTKYMLLSRHQNAGQNQVI